MDIKPLGDARAHYWKVTKMADAVGVSLVAAWDAGKLSSSAHAGMVDRCRGCAQAAACGRLLEGRPALDLAPQYCENKDVFSQMKSDATQ